MTYKALGLISCTFFLWAISCSFASDYDEAQALRLFANDAENPETIPPGPVADQSKNGENAVYGDLDCCQSCCCPRWTVTADAMILDRIGNKSTTILGPLENTFGQPIDGDRLDSNDFSFPFAAGPRLSLIRKTQCYDYEVLYFGIDGWSDCKYIPQSLNPASPLFINWSSRLYNVELNVRWNPCCQVTLLAGFRWAQLREDFVADGILNNNAGFVPVADIATRNNLYGFQIGGDATFWRCGCFSIDGLGKVGIYGNHAEQTTFLGLPGTAGQEWFSNSTNHTALIGELGLQARYQVTQHLAMRAGYELLWLDGVAIAPVQFQNPQGIDSNATVFYHGATAGFEYSF